MLETIKYLIGSPGPSGFGSRSTAEDVTQNCPHLPSLTAIITGATSGIGAETARVLAKRGVRLVLPVRTIKGGEDTRGRILMESPQAEVLLMELDLSSLSSVRNFVNRFLSLNLPLNLLINNAGRFSYGHGISEDGIEMTFATNYLGHFELTMLLLKKMVETAKVRGIQGRIVTVSSCIHSWFSGDILRYLHHITFHPSEYDATRAYALSKLANVLHTKELSRRLHEMKANVTVNCVHPGVVRTRLNRDREGFVTDLVFFFSSKFMKTVSQGAATTCYVATNPELEKVSGKFFADCNEMIPSKLASNAYEARRLWIASEIMASSQNPKTVFDLMLYDT
uniref:Protochlorophyllide reductase n=1 Tax=Opuntia streptacantha TaxID=393608 RepID=A0A7C8YDI0_OPUST